MNQDKIKEALLYAFINGFVIFTGYMGVHLITDDPTMNSLITAIGLGMFMFANYMINVQDEIDIETPDMTVFSPKNRKGTMHPLKILKKRALLRII